MGIAAGSLPPPPISLGWQRWHLSFPMSELAGMCRGSWKCWLGARRPQQLGTIRLSARGGDAAVTPLFVASFSLLMTNPSVPVSAALAESRFPDKSNNSACLESRDYFLKCKRGTSALTVVAKVHLPFPLSRAAGSFPHARLALVLSRWLAGALPPSEEILLS